MKLSRHYTVTSVLFRWPFPLSYMKHFDFVPSETPLITAYDGRTARRETNRCIVYDGRNDSVQCVGN